MKKEIKLKPHETAHLKTLKQLSDFRQQQAQDAGAALESYLRTLSAEYNPSGGRAEVSVALDTIVVDDPGEHVQ